MELQYQPNDADTATGLKHLILLCNSAFSIIYKLSLYVITTEITQYFCAHLFQYAIFGYLTYCAHGNFIIFLLFLLYSYC